MVRRLFVGLGQPVYTDWSDSDCWMP